MNLQELKSKAFDIRAAIDFKQSEIAKLTEEYNKIATEIFKMEQEGLKAQIKETDEKLVSTKEEIAFNKGVLSKIEQEANKPRVEPDIKPADKNLEVTNKEL